MKIMQSRWWLWAVFIWFEAKSNNLLLYEINLVDEKQIQVSISWEHSWRYDSTKAPYNHDAVWIWGKIQENGIWSSLLFKRIHTIKTETVIQKPIGFLIRRKNIGEGNIQDKIYIELVNPISEKTSEIRLFGTEMVFVPEGSFYVGDSVSQYTLRTKDGNPYQIENEGTIENLFAKSEQNNFHPQSLTSQAPHLPIPAKFPKGFKAFYCMKYEISQEQFADFLNTLTFQQQKKHTVSSPDAPWGTPALYESFSHSARNDIVILRSGIEPWLPATYGFLQETNGKHRACNFLHWQNLMAYLDWAGLRPMTELEFEKACLGFSSPFPRQLAHGTEEFVRAKTILQDGTPFEFVAEIATFRAGVVLSGRAAHEQGIIGPLRCGFAALSQPNRLQSGTSYWGIFELSGNVWEQVINLSSHGVQFDGQHGDGNLTEEGFSDALPAEILLNGNGIGLRGGAWNSFISDNLTYPFRDLAIADRYYIYTIPQRLATVGGRGVLTFE
ncbi:MAG: formylglycine-generating enzyme family protein [Cytophagales bacterium]|nr:formylglycine-generating enzyme family protein [Cytophagales bacterium]MDW8383350.1 hypothetical protein [Flammeovirgaceae bacterium]